MDSNCKSGRCQPRRPNPERQRELVTEWNRLNPEGTKVNVRKDDGSTLETVTRSPAWLMGEHTAVVLVDGIAGGYMLERVTVRD